MSGQFYTQRLAPSEFLREYGMFDLPTTTGQAAGAVLEAPTMTGLLMRQQEVSGANAAPGRTGRNRGRGAAPREAADFVDPQTLNERYRDLGLNFERPQTEEAARLIAEEKRAEMIRNDIIRRAPGGVTSSAAMLGAGLASMAIDPLEVASAFVPVVGQARMAGLIARFGNVGGRTIAGAIEGTVGAAITEPIYYGLSKQQQLDYTMADAALNVGLGSVLGGGIGAAAGGLARLRGSAAKVDIDPNAPPFEIPQIRARPVDMPGTVARQTPEQKIASFRASVAQIAEGKSVDVAPMARTQRPETLMEFLSRSGGVQDQGSELSQINAADWTRAKPGRRRVVTEDGMPLDRAAELAQEAGYIENRDIRELLDAVDAEARGTPRLTRRDLNTEGMTPEQARLAQIEAERHLEEFDAMVEGLREVGMRDVTPEEVQRGIEIGRRDGRSQDFDHIAERLAVEGEAPAVARNEMQPERDRLADFNASRQVSEADEIDVDGDVMDLEEVVSGYALTDAEAREIELLNEYEARANAYGETARVAAACLVR